MDIEELTKRARKSQYMVAWTKKNWARIKPVRTFYKKRRMWVKRMQAIEYLGGRCRVCGYASNLNALQFDHVVPLNLDGRIRMANKWGLSWARIVPELDKCQLLCANCHAVKTAKDRGY